jgi:O-antigen/teichoic acid export membrane protein
MGTTSRQIGAAMVWSVLARVVRFALGMGSSVLVVRSLGDHDYGVLSLVRAILMFVVILCSAGLGQAALKFLPALRVERSSSEARRLVRRVMVLHLGLWVAATVVGYAARGWFGAVFDFEGIGTVVAFGVALVVFELFFTVMSQVLNSNYDTRVLSMATMASHSVYIVVLIVALPAGAGVLGVLAAAAAGNLVASLMILPRLSAATDFGEAGSGFRIEDARLVRYALPFAAVGVLNLIVWRQSETIFLGHFRGAEETGYFDLAYRMAQIVLEFVPGAVWPLVMAGVSEVYARNSASLVDAIDRYYRMLFILCAPISVTGIVLGGRMISILFGSEMEPAAVPTQIFFGIFMISFFGTPLSMALYVMEKTHVNLVIYVILAVVNVGLDLVLIPKYGVPGAMIPVAAVIFVSPFIYRAVVGRLVDGLAIPYRFIGRCFLASSSVLLLIPALRFVDGLLELAVAFALALVLLALSFKLVRVVGVAEREMLGSIPIPLAGRLLKFVSS